MNNNSIKDMANREMPVFTALRSMITNINFINIGTIKAVHDENYVDVVLYYKTELGEETVIPAVRLLHIGTTKCKLKIVPAVGDNVLLLCPKDFIEKLEYHRQADVSKKSTLPFGDMNMCGILIREESDENVKTSITVDQNGNVTLDTEGDININSKKTIHMNGNENSFVKYNEFETALTTFLTALNSHTHAVTGQATGQPTTPMTFDISNSKSASILLKDSST